MHEVILNIYSCTLHPILIDNDLVVATTITTNEIY